MPTTKRRPTLARTLRRFGACTSAVRWVGRRTLRTAWRDCVNGEWMAWLCECVGLKVAMAEPARAYIAAMAEADRAYYAAATAEAYRAYATAMAEAGRAYATAIRAAIPYARIAAAMKEHAHA